MVQLLRLLCGALIGLFQSSARREAEILVLRQQINVLRRKSPKRPALNNADRASDRGDTTERAGERELENRACAVSKTVARAA
jgi:hypothetical protein